MGSGGIGACDCAVNKISYFTFIDLPTSIEFIGGVVIAMAARRHDQSSSMPPTRPLIPLSACARKCGLAVRRLHHSLRLLQSRCC